ncbi:hypothetical protein TNCV_4139391 [Trichonephila clavipes]|nr:hypothetical protein TNCV_4139391 [Trichonephila clavipes]
MAIKRDINECMDHIGKRRPDTISLVSFTGGGFICQDSPKDVLSDSGLEIELAIPFVPNRDPPDTPQQSELGEVLHYHPSE